MRKDKKMAKIEHIENGFKCFFDKNHKNQKVYRDSAAIWLCVPAMAKMQSDNRFKEIYNQSDLFIAMAKELGITLDKSDLNRSKEALAQSDSETIKAKIIKAFKLGFTEEQIKRSTAMIPKRQIEKFGWPVE